MGSPALCQACPTGNSHSLEAMPTRRPPWEKVTSLSKDELKRWGVSVRYQTEEAQPVKMTQSEKTAQSDYQRRLLSVPTPVIVTLAERKQTLASLLALSPGSILPFETDCDQPLQLSVGGRSMGTVDVVKVGDKFGVRIRQWPASKTG